jgi:hypothetical protein
MSEPENFQVPEEDAALSISDAERKRQRENLAKRSAAGMEKRYTDQNRADLEAAERLNAPPTITEPKCHVCQSQHRLWIERQLMKGIAYKAIADSIPSGPDRRSISHHAKHHMPMESAYVRAVLEEEAGLLDQNVEEGAMGAFSMRGALAVMVRKGFDDAMAGITTVEPRDIIQMIKAYQEMSDSASVKMVEEAKASISIFMDAIKNVFTDTLDKEQADELSRAIVLEIKRLREQNEIESHIENHMRILPRG